MCFHVGYPSRHQRSSIALAGCAHPGHHGPPHQVMASSTPVPASTPPSAIHGHRVGTTASANDTCPLPKPPTRLPPLTSSAVTLLYVQPRGLGLAPFLGMRQERVSEDRVSSSSSTRLISACWRALVAGEDFLRALGLQARRVPRLAKQAVRSIHLCPLRRMPLCVGRLKPTRPPPRPRWKQWGPQFRDGRLSSLQYGHIGPLWGRSCQASFGSRRHSRRRIPCA